MQLMCLQWPFDTMLMKMCASASKINYTLHLYPILRRRRPDERRHIVVQLTKLATGQLFALRRAQQEHIARKVIDSANAKKTRIVYERCDVI